MEDSFDKLIKDTLKNAVDTNVVSVPDRLKERIDREIEQRTAKGNVIQKDTISK